VVRLLVTIPWTEDQILCCGGCKLITLDGTVCSYPFQNNNLEVQKPAKDTDQYRNTRWGRENAVLRPMKDIIFKGIAD
jgi:hypothetical protein